MGNTETQSPPELNATSWADTFESSGGKATIAVLCDMLGQAIDRSLLKSKQGIDYMDVTTIRDQIDKRIGPHRWDWEVTDTESLTAAPYFVVRGRMTIHGSDGSRVRTGGGAEGLWEHQPYQEQQRDGKQGPVKTKAYGDPFTNAEATALRRAAMGFGFSRELWRK